MKAFRILILLLFVFLLHSQEKKVVVKSKIAGLAEVQNNFRKKPLPSIQAKELHPSASVKDYKFGVVNVEKINPKDNKIERIKRKKTLEKQKYSRTQKNASENGTAIINPIINSNFIGNTYNGYSPPDNNIAVSANHIVSVMNSNMSYFNKSGTELYNKSFSAFFNNQYTAILYDPVIIYDPVLQRFFMAILHGNTPTTSKVILLVSQTSNPNDGWWYYEINGDLNGNGEWFDYPKIGISDKDVFITGNLYDANDSYTESAIIQIDKNSVKNGGQMQGLYWTGLNSSPFTLLPVSGATTNYGPGIYLISVKNNATSILLYDITSNATDPNVQIKSYTVSTSQNITIGGNALQKGTSTEVLDVGDNRALSGFYKNGIIHFVHNNEYTNSYNGISYHRITVSTLSDWYSTFGASGYDYCYPAVAWAGKSATDKTVVIGFLRSADIIYPEMRVVVCDDQGNWSNSKLVKDGLNYVDILNGTTERWGDYTGAAIDPASNNVWIFGAYGSNSNKWGTWIAEISTSAAASIIYKQENNIKTFPNPADKLFTTEFYLPKSQIITVKLLSSDGKTVKTFLKDKLKQGKNKLFFDSNALPNGAYFLKISDENDKTIYYEKVIVNH